jgi:RHS repeat-associated protein
MRAKTFINQNCLARHGRLFGSLLFLLLIGSLDVDPKFSSVIGIAKAATAPTLQIDNYVLISKRKASNTQYDYTYQARVSNPTTATAYDVKAEADSLNPAIKLQNSNLKFGIVPAGGSLISRDTFTLRKAESTVFNPADLHWQFDLKFFPSANAGPDQSVAVGSIVYLDGSGSGNDDEHENEDLGYQWSFISKPVGSTAILSNSTSVNSTFIADKAGTYTLQLLVQQENRISGSDSVVINTINSPPVADAGPDQSAKVGSTAVLDGSRSNDADNDPLTYKWTLTNKPSTSQAIITSSTAVNPGFIVDKSGIYSIQLVVNDGHTDSEASIVLVTTLNSRPVAQAGNDQGARVNDLVTLDGSASSDVDGDALTYTWSLMTKPTGSIAALNNLSAVKPYLTLDKPGVYVSQLIVHDAATDSDPDTVIITTENSRPIANPGLDQTVSLNSLVHLDGTASTDPDVDPLTYQWSFVSKPTNSGATLSNTIASNPTFTADKSGNYVLELIVNDGKLDSLPATITISTLNSRPVADTGLDQLATQGLIILDGTASSDADNNPLSYHWSLLSKPANSQASLNNPAIVQPRFTADYPGFYVGQLIVNDGHLDSDPDTVTVEVPSILFNHPPVISSVTPVTATVGQLYSYPVVASDPDSGDTLTYSLSTAPTGMTIDAITGLVHWTPTLAQLGSQAVTVQVKDSFNAIATQNVTLTVTSPVTTTTIPNVIGQSRAAAVAALTSAKLNIGTLSFDYSNTAASGQVIQATPSANTVVQQGTAINLVISLGPNQGLPPDPAVVAPTLDATVATPVSAASEFLYTGSNPLQTGVAPGTLDTKRVAVIRGKVLDKQNNSLSGVTITVSNHPELGQTVSRADGFFDLAVNGGGFLTVNYSKTGYLNAQRQVKPGWQSYQSVDDVVLVAKDTTVTTVDLTSATPIQIAQGSVQTDASGSRQATVLIPQGTQAQILMPAGSTQPISSLNLRFTEYTVGANGPKAMPGPLPPTSGYTYAVEIGADEATTSIAGKEVLFNQPVYFYVENFLGFPVGIQVPVGYYDKDKSAWIPSKDGRIVKIVGIAGGLADLDTNGDNIADNDPALGITTAERTQLATTYSVGQSLQRVSIDHFSTYDLNYGVTPVSGSTPPNQALAKSDASKKLDEPCLASGSIIECENQTLGETLAITGTPYTLNYRSDRVQGRKGSNKIEIPLIGATVPGSLQRIDLEIRIAGRIITQSFPASPNQNYSFTWDGLDAYGRPVSGEQNAQIRIGYAYPGFYNLPPYLTASFGATSGQRIPGDIPSRQPAILWQEYETSLGQEDARKTAQAGWEISAHHRYNPFARVMTQGNGSKRSLLGSITTNVISTMAGGVTPGFGGDGGLATQALFNYPSDIAFGADGSLYISDNGNHRIRRVGQDGIITTVAGNGTPGFSGDGGPALQASLNQPSGIAIAADGSLYFVDSSNNRIRRVGSDGIISTVAGNGGVGFSGDGGPATQAWFYYPNDIAFGTDGSLYISDTSNSRIRRVGTDGIITTIAGGIPYVRNGDSFGYYGDGGPATQALLYYPYGLAVGADGSLYIADSKNYRVRRIGPDGIITTVAGSGTAGYSGDGGLATLASMTTPSSIAFGTDGNLYISDNGRQRIRRVDQEGIISSVAGIEPVGQPGNGGLASQASLYAPWSIALSPEGDLYVTSLINHNIRRISPQLPGFNLNEIAISSEDGSELYRFDPSGRHISTLNALTGATLYSFTYDTQGRLNQITDGDGLITKIERDAFGNPSAIVAPFGQRTTFVLDSNSYLAKITNPAGESHDMVYTADGLLTSFKDPRGNASTFTYDALGKLFTDTDANTGGSTLTRTELTDGHTVAVTSALNRVTSHTVHNLTTGDRERKHTQPDNTVSTTLEKTDGTFTTTEADGTVTTLLQGPDPRFSMLSPITKSLQTSTGGLTFNLTSQRTAVLATANNPLSLTTLTDIVTLNGRTQRTVYDAASKTFTSTSPAARQSKTVIDNLGRVAQTQTTGLLSVNLTYDPQGRPSTIAQGSGVDERLVNFTYNPQGYLATVTDPLGRQVNYEYDLAGRVTRQILPDTREILFTYDANGNLASLLPPGQPAHNFTYSPVNLTASTIPPNISAGTNNTLYSYNLDKQLLQVQRPDGQTMGYTYDTAGRPSTMTIPEGNYIYSYNPTTGKLASVTTPDGLGLNYTFTGALPTETSWSGVVAGTVGKTYDNDFRINTLSVNGANPFSYQYDNDSLLTAIGNTTLGVNLALSRDAQNGLLTGTTLGNLTDVYTYNGFGEVTQYLVKFAATDLYKTGFTRDKLGRIAQKIETVNGITSTFDYAYDAASRLIEVKLNGVVQSSFGYDANSNRTSQNGNLIAHYDAQDRLLDYNNATYDYTANGELKSKIIGTATTSYNYDVLGNLRHIILPSGTTLDYVIDGQNRRIGKKRNNVLEQGFLYQDQLKPIAELDSNGNILSRFVYATDANVPDLMIRGGATYRIIKDHLGSPKLVVDIATNTVIQQMSYDVWGNVIQDTNPGFQPFGFAGGLYDLDTKLSRFGARDFDAQTGRWTAKDPILFSGGDTNLYGYVVNDPVNAIDPLGLWAFSFEVYGGVGGGVAFGRDDSTGQPFFALRYGYGYGGGFDYDPFGKRPGSNSEDKSHGMSAGLYCKAGVRNGPFKGGLSANAGAETGANSNYFYGSFVSPKFSFTNRGAGISASAAAGAEFSFFGQGK